MDVLDPAEIAAGLRRAGLRVTRPRLAVYRALHALGGHRSAEEVHEALIDSGESLSRTSVYNALDRFSRAGLVLGADAGPGRALYEVAAKWHHHAVCRACGHVTDVPCVLGSKPCLEAGSDWGVVDEAQVIFRGLCRDCASKQTRASRHR